MYVSYRYLLNKSRGITSTGELFLEDSDLITQKDAAELRGVSVASINDLVRRGRLRSIERFGRRLVYRSEVAAFEPSRGGWTKGRPRKTQDSKKPPTEASGSKKKPARKKSAKE
jgi:hypothetical protein